MYNLLVIILLIYSHRELTSRRMRTSSQELQPYFLNHTSCATTSPKILHRNRPPCTYAQRTKTSSQTIDLVILSNDVLSNPPRGIPFPPFISAGRLTEEAVKKDETRQREARRKRKKKKRREGNLTEVVERIRIIARPPRNNSRKGVSRNAARNSRLDACSPSPPPRKAAVACSSEDRSVRSRP